MPKLQYMWEQDTMLKSNEVYKSAAVNQSLFKLLFLLLTSLYGVYCVGS